MIKTFTKKHVLLYLYDELDETLKAPLLSELASNEKLMRFYSETRETLGLLEAESIPGPSATSLQIILEESGFKQTASA